MAFSTTSTRPLINLKHSITHYSPPLHQPKKKKPVILFSNAHFTPPLRSACNECFRAKFGSFTNPSRPKLRFSVKVGSQNDYSSGDEAQSLIPEATQQENYSWVSVIIPFVFPALGGLLFGYDIGATSGATISLTSAELSGTTWFNLTAVQLGLVEGGENSS